MLLRFDVYEFSFGIDESLEQAVKNQVIIFKIENYKHIPLVSFCLEDLKNYGGYCEDVVEMYEDLEINKDSNGDIKILFQTPMLIKGHPGQNSLFIFKTEEKQLYSTHPIQGKDIISNTDPAIRDKIKKAKFNNYNYIEKTILDRVQIQEEIIGQLINQVKKLTSHVFS